MLALKHVPTIVVLALTAQWSVAAEPLESSGEENYQRFCAACHGADGKGNQIMGAPNLTDNIWLYGGSPELIKHTIRNGRNGNMPAHQDLLSEDRRRLLTAYVLGLSK